MTFLLFILIVLFLIFGWPMLRVWLALRNARNNVRDMFGGNPRTSSGRANSQSTQQNGRHRRPRHKIIDPSVGEYVEFEEIKTFEGHTPDGDTHAQQRITYSESQITDVEWEDIKS